MNELSSRNTSKSSNILEIQVDNGTLTISTSGDKAEAFNKHFTNIAQVLAKEVPAAEVKCQNVKCQMFVYSGHALSYT